MVPPGPWRRRPAAEADRRTEERMACRCRAGMGRRAFLSRAAAVAIATLPLAGCDAAAAVDFWRRMAALEGGGGRVPPFLAGS